MYIHTQKCRYSEKGLAVEGIFGHQVHKCKRKMSDMVRKLYGINVCKKPSVVLMKWRIEFYSEKNETLLPNKVRAGSSVIINRSV